VRVGNAIGLLVVEIGDRVLIWLGWEMRSGLGLGNWRSRFDLVRVGNAIGFGFGELAIALLFG